MLARAGEAAVYTLDSHPKLLLKIFEEPLTPREVEKIGLLAKWSRPPAHTAMPLELLSDPNTREPFGYLQRYFTKAVPLAHMLDSNGRTQLGVPDDLYTRVKLARLLAEAIARLHECQLVMGDVSDSNFLIDLGRFQSLTTAFVIDCNSLQFSRRTNTGYDVFVSGVATEAFAAPEVQPTDWSKSLRSIYSDSFGLGVLAWQLIFNGSHPFAVVTPSSMDVPPLGERIQHKQFPFAAMKPLPPGWKPVALDPPLAILPIEVERLFVKTFTADDPRDRPLAKEWIAAFGKWEADLHPNIFLRSLQFVNSAWATRVDNASGRLRPFAAILLIATALFSAVLLPFADDMLPNSLSGPHGDETLRPLSELAPSPRDKRRDQKLFPDEFMNAFRNPKE